MRWTYVGAGELFGVPVSNLICVGFAFITEVRLGHRP